jgi:hypothetical protein
MAIFAEGQDHLLLKLTNIDTVENGEKKSQTP